MSGVLCGAMSLTHAAVVDDLGLAIRSVLEGWLQLGPREEHIIG